MRCSPSTACTAHRASSDEALSPRPRSGARRRRWLRGRARADDPLPVVDCSAFQARIAELQRRADEAERTGRTAEGERAVCSERARSEQTRGREKEKGGRGQQAAGRPRAWSSARASAASADRHRRGSTSTRRPSPRAWTPGKGRASRACSTAPRTPRARPRTAVVVRARRSRPAADARPQARHRGGAAARASVPAGSGHRAFVPDGFLARAGPLRHRPRDARRSSRAAGPRELSTPSSPAARRLDPRASSPRCSRRRSRPPISARRGLSLASGRSASCRRFRSWAGAPRARQGRTSGGVRAQARAAPRVERPARPSPAARPAARVGHARCAARSIAPRGALLLARGRRDEHRRRRGRARLVGAARRDLRSAVPVLPRLARRRMAHVVRVVARRAHARARGERPFGSNRRPGGARRRERRRGDVRARRPRHDAAMPPEPTACALDGETRGGPSRALSARRRPGARDAHAGRAAGVRSPSRGSCLAGAAAGGLPHRFDAALAADGGVRVDSARAHDRASPCCARPRDEQARRRRRVPRRASSRSRASRRPSARTPADAPWHVAADGLRRRRAEEAHFAEERSLRAFATHAIAREGACDAMQMTAQRCAACAGGGADHHDLRRARSRSRGVYRACTPSRSSPRSRRFVAMVLARSRGGAGCAPRAAPTGGSGRRRRAATSSASACAARPKRSPLALSVAARRARSRSALPATPTWERWGDRAVVVRGGRRRARHRAST